MCFWDGHTAWIQVALQPMHASVWDRRNVEYLDLGGEGYSFRERLPNVRPLRLFARFFAVNARSTSISTRSGQATS